MPKHVGVVKDHTFKCATCAMRLFYECKLNKIHRMDNLKILHLCLVSLFYRLL